MVSMCYAPYSMGYLETEEFHRGVEATLDVLGTYHNAILDRVGKNEIRAGPRDALGLGFVRRALVVVQQLEFYLEVVLARRVPQKRWAVIATIEVVKALLRLRLLSASGGRLLRPYTPEEAKQLEDRKKSLEMAYKNFPGLRDAGASSAGATSSGDGGAPYSDLILMYAKHGRGVHPHGKFFLNQANEPPRPSRAQVAAEVLHIVRPAVYAVMRYLDQGHARWGPWVSSLALDIASQCLHRMELGRGDPEFRTRLSARAWLLVLYLFRKPFLGKYSKGPLKTLLNILMRIPFIGPAILGPVLEITVALAEKRYFMTAGSSPPSMF